MAAARTEAVCALIPAAGRGVRFGGTENKVFSPLLNRPLLGWTLEAFAQCSEIDAIVLVGAEAELGRLRELGERWGGGKLRAVVPGGNDRQSSVRNGLAVCEDEFIAVHDAARPCITPHWISACVAAARIFEATTLALPVADTLVRGHEARLDGPDVERENLFAIQTPQVFRRSLLVAAHDSAARSGIRGTDDAGLVRRLRGTTHYVKGYPENIKVTHPEDMALAEAILMRREQENTGYRETFGGHREGTITEHRRRRAEPPPYSAGLRKADAPTHVASVPAADLTPPSTLSADVDVPVASLYSTPSIYYPPFRIGHGYDVHSFAEGRKLFLGGVEFESAPLGLLGHSDADVILHALCDALLGSAGMGDIGVLFPPSDMRHKDRRSTEFLDEVRERLDAAGWAIGNVDITVLAEKPKIGPKADAIRDKIAVHLGIQTQQIGIKATTNEGMGFVGRGEGIAVHATALIMRKT